MAHPHGGAVLGAPLCCRAIVIAALAVAGCGGGSGDGGGTTTAAASVVVPDLRGLSDAQALARICAAGLAPGTPSVIPGTEKHLSLAEINRRLRVVSSDPAAGASVPPRTRVSITLKSPSAGVAVSMIQSCDAVSSSPKTRTSG